MIDSVRRAVSSNDYSPAARRDFKNREAMASPTSCSAVGKPAARQSRSRITALAIDR